MKLTSDDAINDAVLEVWRQGGEFAMRDVVEAPFDEMFVFHERQSADDVNQAAGFELISSRFYVSSTHLFLFRHEGVTTQASMIYPDCFTFGSKEGVYSADAKVSGSGGETLVLLEG